MSDVRRRMRDMTRFIDVGIEEAFQAMSSNGKIYRVQDVIHDGSKKYFCDEYNYKNDE